MLIVQKFGGSSIADGDRLRRAAGICMRQRQNGNEVVVVVSAMGDTTDLLADRARVLGGKPSPREMDALITTGEEGQSFSEASAALKKQLNARRYHRSGRILSLIHI